MLLGRTFDFWNWSKYRREVHQRFFFIPIKVSERKHEFEFFLQKMSNVVSKRPFSRMVNAINLFCAMSLQIHYDLGCPRYEYLSSDGESLFKHVRVQFLHDLLGDVRSSILVKWKKIPKLQSSVFNVKLNVKFGVQKIEFVQTLLLST